MKIMNKIPFVKSNLHVVEYDVIKSQALTQTHRVGKKLHVNLQVVLQAHTHENSFMLQLGKFKRKM